MKKLEWKRIRRFVVPALLALALSAVGSAGFFCLLTWYKLVSFGEIMISPIDYRASIIVGILCLAAAVMLFLFYIISRHKNFTLRGVALDIGVLLISFFPLYYLWDAVYELLTRIV